MCICLRYGVIWVIKCKLKMNLIALFRISSSGRNVVLLAVIKMILQLQITFFRVFFCSFLVIAILNCTSLVSPCLFGIFSRLVDNDFHIVLLRWCYIVLRSSLDLNPGRFLLCTEGLIEYLLLIYKCHSCLSCGLLSVL